MRRCVALMLSIGVVVWLLVARPHPVVVGVYSATVCEWLCRVHPIGLVASWVVMSVATAVVWTRATVRSTTATTASSVVAWLAVVVALSTRNGDIA